MGVKKPGTASSPCALAARVRAGSACGVTISRPPARAMSATCASRHHRAGADQQAGAEVARQRGDAVERVGRVQRHLDDGDAGLFQRGGDGLDFMRLHAAQDGDQRAAGEVCVQCHAACAPIAARPCAAAVAVMALGVAAAGGDGAGIQRGQLRRADHVHHRAALRRQRRAHLVADQDAGQVGRRCRSPPSARSAPGCARRTGGAAGRRRRRRACTPWSNAAALVAPSRIMRPRMVWPRSAANASPVRCVVKPVIRPASIRAHFEWLPGRQARPLPPIAARGSR